MTLDVPAGAGEATGAGEAAAWAAKAARVVVRPLESLAELGAAIAVFDEIWEPGDGNSSIGVDTLRAMTKAGNYASGAYDVATGALLGACVGFFGPPSHAELHSHIAGVVPAGLRRGVGFALKLHQRAWCLRQGVSVVTWTYDPLIRRNAYFNLVKLGARPAEYLRNFYGAMDDAINTGTETDRMLVRWDLRSAAASEACAGRPRPASFEVERARGGVVVLSASADGHPVPGPAAAQLPAAQLPDAGGCGPRRFLVGVPADIEALRLADPGLAATWRAALRDALVPLMAGGGRVTGFDRSGWYVVSTEGEER